MTPRNRFLLVAFAATAFVTTLPLSSSAQEFLTLDSKIDSMKKAGVGPVKFPHVFHQKKFKCGACHEAVFKAKKGANDISMKKNMEGKFCGTAECHNSANAFALHDCARCHTDVKPSSAKSQAAKTVKTPATKK